MDGLRLGYSPDDPSGDTTPLCLSIPVVIFELRETGDWDLFRARGKRGGFRKPLRLPRARSPGTGEGGDWRS